MLHSTVLLYIKRRDGLFGFYRGFRENVIAQVWNILEYYVYLNNIYEMLQVKIMLLIGSQSRQTVKLNTLVWFRRNYRKRYGIRRTNQFLNLIPQSLHWIHSFNIEFTQKGTSSVYYTRFLVFKWRRLWSLAINYLIVYSSTGLWRVGWALSRTFQQTTIDLIRGNRYQNWCGWSPYTGDTPRVAFTFNWSQRVPAADWSPPIPCIKNIAHGKAVLFSYKIAPSRLVHSVDLS